MRQNVFISSMLAIILIGLYSTTRVNYLLFHSLAEIFSIVVAFSLFMIAWNSRQYIKNPYLLFIGIAYFFVGFVDLLHTLAYQGMPIFFDNSDYATQLWIGARYMESLTLLLAFAFLQADRLPRPDLIFGGYFLVTVMLIMSIFYWKIFPTCFAAVSGLTPFKKISEYIICAILLLNIYLLRKNREKFQGKIYQLLQWSLICTIISELAFTFYVSTYGFSNLVGHYFKIFSFFLIYQAIIKNGIEHPFELIFRELDQANQRLRQALVEIKTLEGILPICCHCKKIRDDQGSWHRLEKYIRERSTAQFSHGICPECLKIHYADILCRDD
jgi:hypothetical protein